MGTHSSILAWKIPWAQEPGGLESMGSQRVSSRGHLHLVSVRWKAKEPKSVSVTSLLNPL